MKYVSLFFSSLNFDGYVLETQYVKLLEYLLRLIEKKDLQYATFKKVIKCIYTLNTWLGLRQASLLADQTDSEPFGSGFGTVCR